MTTNIHDMKVTAPGELEMTGNNNNPEAIRAWWNNVKLYVRTMDELDRIAVLTLDPDRDTFYLSSVPEDVL